MLTPAELAASAPDFATLRVGDPLKGLFCVMRKELGQTRAGKQFLNITLINGRRQSIDGKVWSERLPKWEHIRPGSIVEVSGKLEPGFPEGAPPQIQAEDVKELPLPHPLQDLMHAVYPGDVFLLEERFHALVARIQQPGIRRFVELFFVDGVPFSRYRTCPAAKSHHHAYIHGLLEHSIEVTELALAICALPEMRPHINQDIIIAGGLMHDAGKTHEYEWEGVPIAMSAIAGLTNHIGVGVQLTMRVHDRHRAELAKLGFDDNFRYHLEHIILSHHGKREWGALIEPQTPSALAIHQADMASAHLRERFEKLRSGVLDSHGRVVGFGKYGLQTDPSSVVETQASRGAVSASDVLGPVGAATLPGYEASASRPAVTAGPGAKQTMREGIAETMTGNDSQSDSPDTNLWGEGVVTPQMQVDMAAEASRVSDGLFKGSLSDLLGETKRRAGRSQKISERPGGKRSEQGPAPSRPPLEEQDA